MPRIKPKAPALVLRKINEHKLETKEWSMYLAFQRGVATVDHYYMLVDIANIIYMAGSSDKKRDYARQYIKKEIEPVIDAIRARYSRTNKIAATGDERIKIRDLIEFNIEFWNKQPGELYAVVLDEYYKVVHGENYAS